MRADLREGDSYGTSGYCQAWNGYFTAPVAGEYTFRGNGDDLVALYLTSNYGSAEPSTTRLLYSAYHQIIDNFWINDQPTAEAKITLEAGKSYYL